MFQRKTSYEIDLVGLKFLAVQTAATVLFICEARKPNVAACPGINDGVYDPIAIKLACYQNWAVHGYTNSLQSMVELLHDYVEASLESTDYFFLEASDRRIITDALSAYQAWKTAHIAADKERMGENWGDASGFNQKDWTDLNSQFLHPTPL